MAHASQLFKDDEDEQTRHVPSDEELQHLTGIGEDEEKAIDTRALQDSERSGDTSSADRQATSGQDAGSIPTTDLRAAEQGAGSIPTKDLREAENDGDLGNPNWYNRAKDQKARLRNRLGKFAKKKWIIGIGVGAGGIFMVFAFIFFFLGAMKIPDFMEHITAYQFTRTTRQFVQETRNTTQEKMGIDAMTAAAKKKAADWFNARPGAQKTKDLWSKYDRFRPNKLISNFDTSGQFKLVYDDKGVLQGVTLNNARTALLDHPTGFQRFVPLADFKDQVKFATDVAPQLDLALKDANVGPIIRFKVAAAIRQRLGIGLVAWEKGRYEGKSAAEAQKTLDEDMVKKINDPTPVGSQTAALDSTTKDANAQLEQDLQDPSKLPGIVDGNGVDPAAQAIEKQAVDSGGILRGFFKTITGIISPLYNIAMPICLVYDGSAIQGNSNFAQGVNQQTSEQMRTAIYLNSAADEIRNGNGASAEAVGALSNRLGHIENYPPEVRAQSGVADTSSYVSTESSPSGSYDYTAFNALFGNGLAGDLASKIANGACPAITNTGVALGAGVLNLFACVTQPEVCSEEDADATIAKSALGNAVKDLVGKFAGEGAATKSGLLASYIGTAPKDFIKMGATVAGATLLTHYIILERMGGMHNGTQSNSDLAVDGDSGLNNYAQMINNQQLHGRALTDAEIAQNQLDDQAFRKQQAQSQSNYTRYASLANPDSLISKAGFAMMAFMKPQAVSYLTNLGAMLLNPLRTFGNLFMSFDSRLAFAADPPTSVNTYYGNVQFGFSHDEMNLIQTDPSYMPLENQNILDDNVDSKSNPIEDQIASAYHDCFDGSKQIGDMLEGGDIVRDKTGNVVHDKGHCSPDNLSFNSPDSLAHDKDNDRQDLIFRWRVAESYSSGVLDQLLAEQDPTGDSSSSSTGSTGSSNPPVQSSDTQRIAKDILNNNNIDLSSYSSSVQQDVKDAASGQPGTAGAMTSAAILQLIDTVGKDHKVLVTAIQSNGQGHCNGLPKSACPTDAHYNGDAVDFGSLDGTAITGRNAPAITIIKIAEGILPSGTGIGQSQCSGSSINLPSGWIEFSDTCNHLHIQVPKGTP